MRKIYLLAFASVMSVMSMAQSTCTDPVGTLSPDIAPQTISSNGGYYEFEATIGCDYSFSHCTNGGSYTGDTYLTITDVSNVTLASNDDFCGLGSQLTWTSTITGTVRIHLGVCCGGSGVCGGGPTRVLAYWSTCSACGAEPVTVLDPAPICNSGDFTLMATSADSVSWFATSNTSDPILDGGPTYATGTIGTTTSYWVAAWDDVMLCYGNAMEVIAEIQNIQTITYNGDTALCENGIAITPNFSPSGGTVSGAEIVAGQFDPAANGLGTYTVYYSADDACGSNDSAMFVVSSATTDPTLYACEDSNVVVTGSMPGVAWYNSPNSIAVLDTGLTYDYNLAQSTSIYYGGLPASFFIDTITETNIVISDHNSFSGDDRGGIAISSNYFYYIGDNNTARIDLDFVGPWTSLPQRDGIFSDIQTGQLYTLWDGVSGPFGTYLGSDYTITEIAPMDEDLNINTGSTITLSTPIVVNNYNNGEFGMFAGQGMLIIWNSDDNNFYHIDLLTGIVSVVGTGFINAYNTENIAFWGTAEIFNGFLSVSYRSNFGSSIERYVISTGTTSTVANFSGISDLACFTVDPNTNRFYFHHESPSTSFGGGSENGGYCDASFTSLAGTSFGCKVEVPIMVSKPVIELGADTTICSNTTLVLDPAAGYNTYTWSDASTLPTLGVNMVGDYYVTVTDSLGCPESDSISIDLNMVTDVELGSDVSICDYQIVVLNAGGGYSSYAWNNGETGQILYVESDTLAIGANTYTVTATDANGCITTDAMDIIVIDCAGIEENGMNLQVYPNPVKDILTVQLTNVDARATVQLFDVQGALVSAPVVANGTTLNVNMAAFADGVYILKVTSNGATQEVRVVKQ